MPANSPAPATTDLAGIDPGVYERRYKTLAVLCLSLVLIVAGNSALNVAIPTLVRDLQASATELQWIVDAYAIVFAGLLLPAGALGDRYGRKGALQIGLGIFAAASLGATFVTDPGQLIAARALMGVGAAFVMPSTLSLLTTVFPPAERGRAIAIWAGFAGAGGAIGPILSGALLEQFWFGSVFFINLPIIAVALGAGAVLIPTSKEGAATRLDPVGGLLSMVGLGSLLFGIIEGPERGWTDPLTLAGFAVGVAALTAFVMWERRSDHPMLDLTWFRDRRFTVGAATIALAFFAMFGVFFLSTQYFQFLLAFSPLQAGLATLPLAVVLVAIAPRSAGFAERFGARPVVSTGLVVLSSGLFYLALASTPDQSYWVLMPGLMLLGAGMALTTAPSTTMILAGLPPAKAGVGSAVNDTVREIGGSLGVAILGSLFASTYRSELVTGALPAELAETARGSVGAALAIARQAPSPELGQQLAASAGQAFADGFTFAFIVGGVVVLAAAAVVARFLPGKDELIAAAAADAERRRPVPV